MDDITRAIEALTVRLWVYRHVRRECSMPLELKGLKAKAMAARAHIGKLDEAYDAFNAKAGSHISDVQGLAEQLGYMADDLSFATAALGNSVAASNASTEAVQPTHEPPPEAFQRDLANWPGQPPAAPPATILNGQPTIRGAVHNPDVQLIRS